MPKALYRSLRPTQAWKFRCSTRRSFLSLPGSDPQCFTATRILPYNSHHVYDLISDIDSYASFVPYCQYSKVTKRSLPDKDGRRWPSEADMTIGWGGFEETFTSRLFCVPGSIVEALGGVAVTTLPRDDLAHHADTIHAPSKPNDIFKSICTRWTVQALQVQPVGETHVDSNSKRPGTHRTKVTLSLDFQFSNPLYAVVCKSVTPQVAGIMIDAFETRATKLAHVYHSNQA
ncbi:hypothetical protein K3495_g1677 [Podosphaera aphanis]|nr:hypothetical protein K3495_g1677 [Podosphaera aphanis]